MTRRASAGIDLVGQISEREQIRGYVNEESMSKQPGQIASALTLWPLCEQLESGG